jgi:hypothetical protein
MTQAVYTYAVMITMFVLLQHVTVRMLARERDRERARADELTNRLLAAWRDGYHIPEPAAEPIEDEPLPPALEDWLSQWEDPAARERFEADIRRKLAQGRTPDQLLMDLEVAS